jgi:hypothetical protein
MQNIVHEMRYESAADLLNDLLPWSSKFPLKDYVFRGHSNANYQLTPTSVREYEKNKIGNFRRVGVILDGGNEDSEFSLAFAEYKLLRDFYRSADSHGLNVPKSDMLRERLYQDFDANMLFGIANGERWLPSDMLESAALAQHYGIPTRLLDWTHDPFVAAFFSSKNTTVKDGELCIWALNSYLMGGIIAGDRDCPFSMVTPHYGGNPNLAAQKGLFTHWATDMPNFHSLKDAVLVDRRPLDELVRQYFIDRKISVGLPVFIKMVLSSEKSKELAMHLRNFGYGPAKIFPGYAGVAAAMTDLDWLAWG